MAVSNASRPTPEQAHHVELTATPAERGAPEEERDGARQRTGAAARSGVRDDR